ncbi:MAG: 50S ribosomal protein L22 [Planctomycetota bacterium]
MEYRASHKFARISPRKARYVMDLVRGKSLNEALEILNFNHRRGAAFIEKVVRSAMANALNRDEGSADVNQLYLKEARVDEGPLLFGRLRYRPRAMGRATPIRKRTSHIVVSLAEWGDTDGQSA